MALQQAMSSTLEAQWHITHHSEIVRPSQCLCCITTSQNHVDLQNSRVTPGYRKVLNRAFEDLSEWSYVNQRGHPDDYAERPKEMNRLLIDHLQWLFESNAGVSAGRHVVLSIHHRHPMLRSFMKETWDSIKSWEMLALVNSRVPMPPLLLDAMFSYAVMMGVGATGPCARDWLSFAVGLLVCFNGLLRPGEWCTMCAKSVAVPAQCIHGLVSTALLSIKNAKNRRTFGRLQVAVIDDANFKMVNLACIWNGIWRKTFCRWHLSFPTVVWGLPAGFENHKCWAEPRLAACRGGHSKVCFG